MLRDLFAAKGRPPGAGRLRRLISVFRADTAGNVVTVVGLSSLAVTVFMGATVDLARSYSIRQKLNAVTGMVCQYATKPSILQTLTATSGQTAYLSAVGTFVSATLADQGVTYAQTVATPFSFTAGGPASVTLAVSVPTAFMSLIGVSAMPVSARSHCFDTPPSLTVPNLVEESFETTNAACSAFCWISPAGILGTTSNSPTISVPSAPAFTGSSGSKSSWIVTGHCLEIDKAGTTSATAPNGSYSVELDCDNGSGTKGNSAISTKVTMAAGSYELRYWYTSRTGYAAYKPTYICASQASDVAWASDGNSDRGAGIARTNQVNVYLDKATASTPPTHTTIDGTQALAGSNLIDLCVFAHNWIERSVAITIATAGDYWLSFAADGASDSYGGMIDHIRLCPGTCSGTVKDNFPWTAYSVLHQEDFESPYYWLTWTASPLSSTGTSGTSASGWPFQTAYGWAAGPANQVSYQVGTCPGGRQCIGSPGSSNGLWSRAFLLVPGYYRLDYTYTTEVTFSGVSATACGATPTAANYASMTGNGTAYSRSSGFWVGTSPKDTNTIGVFMSHPGLVSQLVPSGSAGWTASYANPSGTVTTTPTASPVAVSLTAYNAAQNNPLLDLCVYAQNPTSRSATIKIQKPAWYWLTFASLGSGGSYTGFVDDVRLTALGSPYMASPPAGSVTIPVPTPAPGGTIAFAGFAIASTPFAP